MLRIDRNIDRIVIIAVLVLLMVGLGFLLYQRLDTQVRDEYEGIIVDKWANFSNSEQGSFPYYRLQVKSDDGQSFAVPVDHEIFQQAQPGMRIRKTGAHFELTRSEQRH